MRIVIGAMARSGSTWTFNAAWLLAKELYGADKVNAGDNRVFEPLPDMDVEIIKTHATDGKQLPADKIVTCVRDLRDAFTSAASAGIVEVAAYNRRGLTPGVIDGMRLLFEAPSYYWAQHAGLVIRYENLHFNKLGHLQLLAEYLFPKRTFDEGRLHKMAIALDLMPKFLAGDFGSDPVDKGFLHGKRHVQGVGVYGHIEQLQFLDVIKIEKQFPEWFEYWQYPLSSELEDIKEMVYD